MMGALWRGYEGPWSFLCEPMWSLTSRRTKRISGSKNSAVCQKNFCNSIGCRAKNICSY